MKKQVLTKDLEIKDAETEEVKAKEDLLYVAGYFTKGKEKGKKVAIQVRNTKLLNPVEPIFEAFPDLDIVIVGKNQTKVRKYFKKLL